MYSMTKEEDKDMIMILMETNYFFISFLFVVSFYQVVFHNFGYIISLLLDLVDIQLKIAFTKNLDDRDKEKNMR